MSQVKISGNASGTGVLTIAAPNTNTDRTLSLPDNTGDILTTSSTTTSKVPAFFLEIGSNQTVTSAVFTKIQFDVGTGAGFDTANYWDSTNHRYTPQIAGYYQIQAKVRMTYSTMTQHNIQVYKNGSSLHQIALLRGQTSASEAGGSVIVQLNGSTDYVEIYNSLTGTGTIKIDTSADGISPTYVQGFLVAPT